LLVSYYSECSCPNRGIDGVKDSFNEELECIFDKYMKILLGDFIAKVGRFLTRQLEMKVYTEVVIIMELE
jgi:hypothetical protein